MEQLLGAAGKEYGLEPKNLVGIPWRVAFALQADEQYWTRKLKEVATAYKNPTISTEIG